MHTHTRVLISAILGRLGSPLPFNIRLLTAPYFLTADASVSDDTRKGTKPTHMNKVQSAIANGTKINFGKVQTLLKGVETATKKRFDNSCELAGIVATAHSWWKLADTKTTLQSQGIDLNAEAFFQEAFGFQKSYAYKLLRLNEAREHLPAFNKACDNDSTLDRSVAGFLKFIKGDSEDEGEGKPETIITFTWKDGVSFKIDSENVIHSKSEVADIKKALKELLKMI